MNHVLIVEDEDFLVRALKNKTPSLILLDLLLPKKNGFDVLKEIRQSPEWQLIPVVILSNLGEDSEIKRALELGANDYFVKSQHPIQEVMEKVREDLQGKG